MLSIADWQRQLAGKTAYAAAKHIISNLTGYRSTSVHRTNDTDSLTRAIEALGKLSNSQPQQVQIHLADLWFVVATNDITSLPNIAYTTQAEAEQAAKQLIEDTAEFRARMAPQASLPSAQCYEDVWRLVRGNVCEGAAIEEARSEAYARDGIRGWVGASKSRIDRLR